MTIGELIEKLSKLPPDATVVINAPGSEFEAEPHVYRASLNVANYGSWVVVNKPTPWCATSMVAIISPFAIDPHDVDYEEEL